MNAQRVAYEHFSSWLWGRRRCAMLEQGSPACQLTLDRHLFGACLMRSRVGCMCAKNCAWMQQSKSKEHLLSEAKRADEARPSPDIDTSSSRRLSAGHVFLGSPRAQQSRPVFFQPLRAAHAIEAECPRPALVWPVGRAVARIDPPPDHTLCPHTRPAQLRSSQPRLRQTSARRVELEAEMCIARTAAIR